MSSKQFGIILLVFYLSVISIVISMAVSIAYGQEYDNIVNELIKTGKFTEQEAKDLVEQSGLNMTEHKTNNTDRNEPWIKIPFEIEANITFDVQ